MIPTSIDGTDITGATIDGTDVQEITVDGDVVFSAQTLPVAYSDLVAWYPFDSAEYGGSNADDVTAIIGGSGDNTAYDFTVNGASYLSSGGAEDINAGSSSGHYSMDGTNQDLRISTSSVAQSPPISITLYAQTDNTEFVPFMCFTDTGDTSIPIMISKDTLGRFDIRYSDENDDVTDVEAGSFSLNTWFHIAMTVAANGDLTAYVDGQVLGTASGSVTSFGRTGINIFSLGSLIRSSGTVFTDALVDDVRIYDKELTASEINQIYQNTEP